jgi:zinc-ribbon domain
MKCTTCGYETQPGAKFCVQCGTTIVAGSAPAPAGMAPLAAPSVTPRPAAASPSATASRPAYTPPASTSATAARPAYTPSDATAVATAARPAYTPPAGASATGTTTSATPGATGPATTAPAASSMRLGLIAGVLVLFAVIGIGSFVAYKMLFPAEPKEAVTTTDSNKAVEPPPAPPAADANKDGTAGTGTAATGSADNNMSSQQTPPAPAADTPVTPAQAADAAKAAAAKAAADAKAKAATPGKTDTPTPPTAPVAGPTTSPPRQAAAPAVAPAPQADRWELMRQAYEVCNKETLFDRLSCNSRVGQQFCKGYWGTVPQCPAGAYGDRGNN